MKSSSSREIQLSLQYNTAATQLLLNPYSRVLLIFFFLAICSHLNGNFHESTVISTSVLLESALRFEADFLVGDRGMTTILVFQHWQENKQTNKKKAGRHNHST